MDCGSTILIFLAFIQATCGQSVTLTVPPAVEQGSDTVYTCTGGEAPYTFAWADNSVIPSVPIFNGAEKVYPVSETKYDKFGVSANEGTSTMTISNTLIEDEGRYRCGEGQAFDEAEFKVEVRATKALSFESTIESSIDMYVATCDAVDGRPNVTITWMLGDDPLSCDSLVETNPTARTDLFSKRSVCTFQATSDNNEQTLKCVFSGHLVPDLNGEITATLDTHRMPTTDITVGFQFPDTSTTVSCVIADPDQPIPSVRNFYIYSNDTLIHQSSTGDHDVEVPESEFDLYTEFTCVAGNYLGNVTSDPTRYDPDSTTTLIPTTTAEPIATEGNPTDTPGVPTTQPSMTTTNETGTPNDPPPIGIIIGCVVAVIVIIGVIIVVVCIGKNKGWFKSSGIQSSGSSNKPSGRAVGSSNGSGSEKDVESPLNGVKDVTAEEKLPQAAPRGHGSIQHTNDNPDQAMYAMVDKKKPAGGGGSGGDAPDRGSGPGQNEPAGMLYADLDLSHKAGHTDKHVPKNENDVVVYSSILV